MTLCLGFTLKTAKRCFYVTFIMGTDIKRGDNSKEKTVQCLAHQKIDCSGTPLSQNMVYDGVYPLVFNDANTVTAKVI